MVTQGRAVVALAGIGKEFERNPLDIFLVSLAAHATQETWTLNLIARSTWIVFVSLERSPSHFKKFRNGSSAI